MSRSSISDQVLLTELELGTVVEVATHTRTYRIECRQGGELLISGHPEFCPNPVSAQIGSTGSRFIPDLICVGMRLEVHFANGTAFRTSPIAEIRVFDVGDYRGQYKVVDARASLVRSL